MPYTISMPYICIHLHALLWLYAAAVIVVARRIKVPSLQARSPATPCTRPVSRAIDFAELQPRPFELRPHPSKLRPRTFELPSELLGL
jgi:hypothetical protein